MPAPGLYRFAETEQVVFGIPYAVAAPREAERIAAERVFVLSSGTLNQETSVVSDLCKALGGRLAGLWDRIGAHTPRSDVVAAANAARSAGADLIITIGGGSITDGGKMVQLCLANNVETTDQLDGYRSIAGKPSETEITAPTVR
jgi:maleylacetate reductase